MASRRKFEFYDEDSGKWVVFTFPAGFETVFVDELEEVSLPGNEFNRFVINVKLFEKNKETITDLEKKEVKFKLRVHYIEEDIKNANGEENLRLGYHDGSSWTTFTKDDSEEEMVSVDSDKWKGHFKVTVTDFTDPVIAWGP